MNKQKNRKNALLLLTGAIAGAAATYYLNTPKGKQLTQNIIDKGRDTGASIANTANQMTETLKERTSDMVAAAGSSIDTIRNKVSSKTENILTEAEDTLDDLALGANIAKEAIKNGSLS